MSGKVECLLATGEDKKVNFFTNNTININKVLCSYLQSPTNTINIIIRMLFFCNYNVKE